MKNNKSIVVRIAVTVVAAVILISAIILPFIA